MSYFRKNIDAMQAYIPGEQPANDVRVIKLNTNENPYPPSPAVAELLRTFDPEQLRKYPHPLAQRFRESVAAALDVPADWVLPGNGSDDLITMIARACLGDGGRAAYATPTFEFYRTQADIQAAGPIEVPYPDDFALPIDALIAARTVLTFVSAPNSPSGTAFPVDSLRRLAEGVDGLLVIDEAYADFANGNAMELVGERDNVVVLRTLSKGYSLAGLRLGYAVAQPTVLEGLLKVKDIYNVGVLPCMLGAVAMDDQTHKAANAEKVKASREELSAALTKLGWRVWPSQANFLLARPTDGDAAGVYRRLRDAGILVRYFASNPRLADKLRITIGTDTENAALVDALQ